MKNKFFKRLYCSLCILLCAVFIFSFAGCSDPVRYEKEKELVRLLREYDGAYKAYTAYLEVAPDNYHNVDIKITFSLLSDGQVFLTDENITKVTVDYDAENEYYFITIAYDDIGAEILTDITSKHIGEKIQIKAKYYDSFFDNKWVDEVVSENVITSTITGNTARLASYSNKATANELYTYLAANCVTHSLKTAITAYNEKCTEYLKQYTTPEYLPASLAVAPTYTDIAEYLQKAKAAGFTE